MTTTAVAGHAYEIGADARELPPIDGWKRRELAGTIWMRCECGVQITGPADEVQDLAAAHQDAHTPVAGRDYDPYFEGPHADRCPCKWCNPCACGVPMVATRDGYRHSPGMDDPVPDCTDPRPAAGTRAV